MHLINCCQIRLLLNCGVYAEVTRRFFRSLRKLLRHSGATLRIGRPKEAETMRQVVVRAVPNEPEDAQRRERLLALLSTGLQRLLSEEPAPDDSTPPVDYSPNLSPTSYTDPTVSEGND